MALYFKELKSRLDYYVDDTVPDDIAIMLFNQCGEDLSDYAGYAKTSVAEFNYTDPIMTLPVDFLEMIELKIKRTSDDDYYRIRPIGLVQPADFFDTAAPIAENVAGYEVFGDAFEIRPDQTENGMLLLRYYAMLPLIKSLDDAPVIKPRFHDAYSLYAAAKYYQNYQDELTAKRDYYDEYLQKKMELKEYTDDARVRTRSKSVYQFRSWI